MATCSARCWTYVKHVFFSFGHALALAGIFPLACILALAAIVPQTWALLTLAAYAGGALAIDGLVILGVSHMPRFRRAAEEHWARLARLAAAEARAALLAELSDAHRRQLLALESLVDNIRASSFAGATPVGPSVETCGNLLATFVRLALRHRRGKTCLGSIEREKFLQEMDGVERAVGTSTGRARDHAERRLAVMHKRSNLWEVRSERLQDVEDQMAAIGERIRLAYEEIRAPRVTDTESVALRVAIPNEEDLNVLRAEDEVDASVLALGPTHH